MWCRRPGEIERAKACRNKEEDKRNKRAQKKQQINDGVKVYIVT